MFRARYRIDIPEPRREILAHEKIGVESERGLGGALSRIRTENSEFESTTNAGSTRVPW
jgi:hypothetical protein